MRIGAENSVFEGTDGVRHGHVFHADMSFLQWVPWFSVCLSELQKTQPRFIVNTCNTEMCLPVLGVNCG